MITNLNKLININNISIKDNIIHSQFSDYVLYFEDKIIGFGWKNENVNEVIGFMGMSAPNNKIPQKIFDKFINENITGFSSEDLMYMFQFAVSENYYWFSPPVANLNMGVECPSLDDAKIFNDYLEIYIEKIIDKTLINDIQNEIHKLIHTFKVNVSRQITKD
jgi:hypothetical protein